MRQPMVSGSLLPACIACLLSLGEALLLQTQQEQIPVTSQVLGQVPGLSGQFAPAQIKSGVHGRCLSGGIWAGVTNEGEWAAQNEPCNSTDRKQIWYFDGKEMKNLHFGEGWCLDVPTKRGASDFGYVYMKACHGGDSQKFRISGPHIRNDYSDSFWTHSCLDSNYAWGDRVFINGCQDIKNQQWTFGGNVSVTASWRPLRPVLALRTETLISGTKKTSPSAQSPQWSLAVAATFQVGGVVSINAFRLPLEICRKMSDAHSEEWSRSTPLECKQTILPKPGSEEYLWQWAYDINADQVENVITGTCDYAVTAGNWEAPKCVPGYCLDSPRCQSCLPGGALNPILAVPPARSVVPPAPAPAPALAVR